MTIRYLTTDAEIQAAFPIMLELRPYLAGTDFTGTIRLQEQDGYRLVGGYDETDRLVSLAGFRITRTLSRGRHLFVDDLVTSSSVQGKGFGKKMIAWLGQVAGEAGLSTIWLDSRLTAKGFYEQIGFEMYTSVPCRITADKAASV